MMRCVRSQSRRWRRCLTAVLLVGILVVYAVVPLLYDEEKAKLKRHEMRKFIDVFSWGDNPTVGCNGNFLGYGEEFVRLRYARLNSKTKVFSIPCGDGIPQYKFQYSYEGTPLQSWLNKMVTYPTMLIKSLKVKKTTTVVINRIEAHNVYHTMCEWYNVFLLSKVLDFKASDIDILLLDDRPPNVLDETWSNLFKRVIRYSNSSYDYIYKDLIWNIIGYESPMNFHHQMKLPFIREFRNFFLKAFNIADEKPLNCDKLTVTLLVRKDYMTHPERINVSGGLVHRKFKNEEEIINEIKCAFRDADLKVVVLEQMSMKEQLYVMANTDVLIGMHGAGMTHVLFLPRHAVVFEMFPDYWPFLRHFKAFAEWRHVKYFGWQNKEKANEFPDFYTKIPLDVVRKHCHAMKNYLCGA